MKKFLIIFLFLVTALTQLTQAQSIQLKSATSNFLERMVSTMRAVRASLPSIVGREVSQTEVQHEIRHQGSDSHKSILWSAPAAILMKMFVTTLCELFVLAYSDVAIAKDISADSFIDMLNSGTWTDRNKASHLIVVLSKKRDPRLLHQLRVRALPSLIEMARWRDPTHSSDSRMILGRVARLPEEQLLQLVARGDVERILSAAQRRDER